MYESFSKERIVLIAGNKTNTSEIEKVADLLKQQLWYSTSADMNHLCDFWSNNFNEHPDFRPNYIVPNINSTIRCLSYNSGFSIVSDFLCSDALINNKIIWKRLNPVENTLYFRTRKKTMYQQEINQLENLLKKNWGN